MYTQKNKTVHDMGFKSYVPQTCLYQMIHKIKWHYFYFLQKNEEPSQGFSPSDNSALNLDFVVASISSRVPRRANIARKIKSYMPDKNKNIRINVWNYIMSLLFWCYTPNTDHASTTHIFENLIWSREHFLLRYYSRNHSQTQHNTSTGWVKNYHDLN